MPSPICTVKDSLSGAVQATSSVATVQWTAQGTIALADATGVSTWSIQCIYTDESTTPAAVNATLSVNATSKTATFSPLAPGQAYIFQSVVNDGKNASLQVDTSLTTTFKVASPSSSGTLVVAANETVQHGPNGWLPLLNAACRGDTVSASLSFFASLYKSSPDGPISIYRRGDSISSVTYQVRYIGTIPTDASVTDASSGLQTTPTLPGSLSSPFETITTTGTISSLGTSGSPDPSYTLNLYANFNPGKARNRPSSTVSKTLTHTIYFTSDVYVGFATSSTISATQVYTTTTQAGFIDYLQRDRAVTYPITASAVGYLYALWPDQAQYTTGTPVFRVNDQITSFQNSYTISITRNGVTRSYAVWRSVSSVSIGSYQLVIT